MECGHDFLSVCHVICLSVLFSDYLYNISRLLTVLIIRIYGVVIRSG